MDLLDTSTENSFHDEQKDENLRLNEVESALKLHWSFGTNFFGTT